jgi:predicted nuclease with TOPRIM domain
MAEQLQSGAKWIEDRLLNSLAELRDYLTDVQANMYLNHGISLEAAKNAIEVTQKMQRLVEDDLHQTLVRRKEREEKTTSIRVLKDRIVDLEQSNQMLREELVKLAEEVRNLQKRLGDDQPLPFPSRRHS